MSARDTHQPASAEIISLAARRSQRRSRAADEALAAERVAAELLGQAETSIGMCDDCQTFGRHRRHAPALTEWRRCAVCDAATDDLPPAA